MIQRTRAVDVGAARLRTGLAGLVLSVLLLVGVTACSDDAASPTTTGVPVTEAPPTTALSGPPVDAVPEGLRSVRAGQCFWPPRDDPEAEDAAVWVVDCGTPHRHEVIDVLVYDGPVGDEGRYPGSAFIQEWADEQCVARFEPFVGLPWSRSVLDLMMWWPSAASWDRADREVVCAVFDPTGDYTTGSYRDTRR